MAQKLVQNKKVSLNYEILETFEAGVQLFGYEVKSLRKKQGSLEGSHITVRGGEAFLIGATIPPYQSENTPDGYEPTRNRKLLLTKKEIGELAGSESKKGLTIVPISIYNKGNKLKLEIGVARGRKKHDKRHTIKEREDKRSIERKMKAEF